MMAYRPFALVLYYHLFSKAKKLFYELLSPLLHTYSASSILIFVIIFSLSFTLGYLPDESIFHVHAADQSVSIATASIPPTNQNSISDTKSPKSTPSLLYYKFTNVYEPALFQLAEIIIYGFSETNNDPSFSEEDYVTFVTLESSCVNTNSVLLDDELKFPVTVDSNSGVQLSTCDFVLSSPSFSVNTKYYVCYYSMELKKSFVAMKTSFITPVQNQFKLNKNTPLDGDVDNSFSLHGPIYTTAEISPFSPPYNGQAFINIKWKQTASEALPLNYGDFQNAVPFFLPCPKDSSTENCMFQRKDLVKQCSLYVSSIESLPSSIIPILSVEGYGTSSQNGQFRVPWVTAGEGYVLCIPYCFSASGICGQNNFPISWIIAINDALYSFLSPNPMSYRIEPSDPKAIEEITLTFTGTELTARDKVILIEEGRLCALGAPLLGSVNYDQVVSFTDSKTTYIKVIVPSYITKKLTGKVCYARLGPDGSVNTFAPVYQLANPPEATRASGDFVVDVLQPSKIEIKPEPTKDWPTRVGQSFQVTFLDTTSNAVTDLVYLISGSSSVCSKGETLPSPSETIFLCSSFQNSEAGPICSILVNPISNDSMLLYICYKKADRKSFVKLVSTIPLSPRNPVFNISSNPWYFGRTQQITITGSFFSEKDDWKFISVGTLCDDPNQVPASISYHVKSRSSTSVIIDALIGSELLSNHVSSCLQLCYGFYDSSKGVIWSSSRLVDNSFGISCNSKNGDSSGYVETLPFPGSYQLYYVSPDSINVSVDKDISLFQLKEIYANETAVAVLNPSSNGGISLSDYSFVKLIYVQFANCIFNLCEAYGNKGICDGASINKDDFIKKNIFTKSSVSSQYLISPNSKGFYMLCISDDSEKAYIPLPFSTQTKDGASLLTQDVPYGFSVNSAYMIAKNWKPDIWRYRYDVWKNEFSISSSPNTFSPLSDMLLLISESVSPNSDDSVRNTMEFSRCLTYDLRGYMSSQRETKIDTQLSTPQIVQATYAEISLSSTSNTAITSGENRVICYYRNINRDRGVFAVTSFTHFVSGANPFSYMDSIQNSLSPTLFRSMQAMNILFRAASDKSTPLSPSKDSIRLYGFSTKASADKCFCGCSETASIILNPSEGSFLSGSSTEVLWKYLSGIPPVQSTTMHYVLCYLVNEVAPVETRMNSIVVEPPIGYFELQPIGVHSNPFIPNVGLPFQLSFVRTCVPNKQAPNGCFDVTVTDKLFLIEDSLACYSQENGDDTIVQSLSEISPPIISNSNTRLTKTFVAKKGSVKLKVCYQSSQSKTNAVPEELLNSVYNHELIPIANSEPSGFLSIPSFPTSGQFLTIQLEECGELCATCPIVNLIRGKNVLCWKNDDAEGAIGKYTGSTCLGSLTSVAFPNIQVLAGEYTVCVSKSDATNILDTVRLQDTLIVGAANPVTFSPVDSNSYMIFVNQGSPVTLDIFGNNLDPKNDRVFMLTSNFNCHELEERTNPLENEYAQLFLPSTQPNPLVEGTSTEQAGVLWEVSSARRRFATQVTTNSLLCSEPDLKCAMRLCYRRQGGTWAEVPLQSSTNKEGNELSVNLFPASPNTVSYNVLPTHVNEYFTATVNGKGLEEADIIFWTTGQCRVFSDSSSAAVMVGSKFFLTGDNSVKIGFKVVMRSIRTGISIRGCYKWRSGIITELLRGSSSSNSNILYGPIHIYRLSSEGPSAESYRGYELLTIAGANRALSQTPENAGIYTNLKNGSLIPFNVNDPGECNYEPFIKETQLAPFPISANFTLIGDIVPEYPSSFGSLRLVMNDNKRYAVCFGYLNPSTNVYRLYRLDSLSDSLPSSPGSGGFFLEPPFPASYNIHSLLTITNSLLKWTFFNVSGTDITEFPENTVLSIIRGTLYDCGLPNVSWSYDLSLNDALSGSSFIPVSELFTGSPSLAEYALLTVCMRLPSHSSAAVSKDGKASSSLLVYRSYPERYVVQGVRVDIKTPLSITFFSDNIGQFSSEDDIYGVWISSDKVVTLSPTQCTITGEIGTPPYKVIRNGLITLTDDKNQALWSLTKENMNLEVGSYILCYKLKNFLNKKYEATVAVLSPGALYVNSIPSPYGFYTDAVKQYSVLSGERFHLFFSVLDNLQLKPRLVFNSESVPSNATENLVLLASVSNEPINANSCLSNVLTNLEIQEIPASFGFKPPSQNSENSLHLVIRATGTYVVCMRRGESLSQPDGTPYKNFQPVTSSDTQQILQVLPSPIEGIGLVPSAPRVGVPSVILRPNFVPNNPNIEFTQFFTTLSSSTSNDLNVLLREDNCYLPLQNEASEGAILVNSSLQIIPIDDYKMRYPFPKKGDYTFCYQISGGYPIASVPQRLRVNAHAPDFFTAPDIINMMESFTLSFFSPNDNIFNEATGNVASIMKVDSNSNDQELYSCDHLEGAYLNLTQFSPVSSPSGKATHSLTIVDRGFYYICFLTSGQLHSFPLERNELLSEYYMFGVSMFGPLSYSTFPKVIHMGESIQIQMDGEKIFQGKDRAKVVEVPINSIETDLDQYCTASAANANAEDPSSGGQFVTDRDNNIPQESITSYNGYMNLRMNSTGKFILCYLSSVDLQWRRISKPNLILVYAPIPSYYNTKGSLLYISETFDLNFHVDASESKNFELSEKDTMKFVLRNSGKNGFDCTESAPKIDKLAFSLKSVNKSLATYGVCAEETVEATVCYKVEFGTWAEVPSQFTPTIQVAPVVISDNPIALFTLIPAVPRPYESGLYTWTFKDSLNKRSLIAAKRDIKLKIIQFVQEYPTDSCKLDKNYTAAIFEKDVSTDSSMQWRISLPITGKYTAFLTIQTDAGSNIVDHVIAMKNYSVTIGQCDPCSFEPQNVWIDNTVNIMFMSTSDSFSKDDILRIIPSSSDLSLDPCGDGFSSLPETNNPFANLEFKPESAEPNEILKKTSFLIPTGRVTNSYYMCYKKANVLNGNFALVAGKEDSQPILWRVLDPSKATTEICPLPPPSSITDVEIARKYLTFGQTMSVVLISGDDSYISYNSQEDLLYLIPQNDETSENNIRVDSFCNAAGISNKNVLSMKPLQNPASQKPIANGWMVSLPLDFPLIVDTKLVSMSLCLKMKTNTQFLTIGESFSIAPPNPSLIVETVPSKFSAYLPNLYIFIDGVELSANDKVFLIESSATCEDTCMFPTNPTSLPNIEYTTSLSTASATSAKNLKSRLLVNITSGFKSSSVFSVCMRRYADGRSMVLSRTPLSGINVAAVNPTSYSTSFVPRVRTQPTFTFIGTDFTESDQMMLVTNGISCEEEESNGIGFKGKYISGSLDMLKTTIAFTVSLTDASVGLYSVCYQLPVNLGRWVRLPSQIYVDKGGPVSFSTSNTPMAGRATVLRFPGQFEDPNDQLGVGDEVQIICPSCDCFSLDGLNPPSSLAIPYGSSVSIVTISDDGKPKPTEMRMGLNIGNYPVCYRVRNSGFGMVEVLKVDVNDPHLWTVEPPLPIVGERLLYTITSGGVSPTLLPGKDEIMFVTNERKCWETPSTDPNGIIIPTAKVSGIDSAPASKTVSITVHFPSLGKNAKYSDGVSYSLCYRHADQNEYLLVPFPDNTKNFINPPSPKTFVSAPLAISVPILNAVITFPSETVSEKDLAYIVLVSNIQSDTICTDDENLPITASIPVFPQMVFSIESREDILPSSNLVICLKHEGKYVMEVPKIITIVSPNPSSYFISEASVVLDAENPELWKMPHLRQYLQFVFNGKDLDATKDKIRFTDNGCSNYPEPTNIDSLVRQGELYSSILYSESIECVSQFILTTDVNTISKKTTTDLDVCYFSFSNNGWTKVMGLDRTDVQKNTDSLPVSTSSVSSFSATTKNLVGSLDLYSPMPSYYTISPKTPRAGQHVLISLVFKDENLTPKTSIDKIGIIWNDKDNTQSWCYNFTTTLEPSLVVSPAALNLDEFLPQQLESSLWQTSGTFRLCIKYKNLPWSDIGSTEVSQSGLVINGPNPVKVATFPLIPRVGQSVQLYFTLANGVISQSDDQVAILMAEASGKFLACDEAVKNTDLYAEGLKKEYAVTKFSETITMVTPVNSLDVNKYSSFHKSEVIRLCYYSASESLWSSVGGSLASSLVDILPQTPNAWEILQGTPSLIVPSAFAFIDPNNEISEGTGGKALGSLDATKDTAWAAPSSIGCNEPLEDCPTCIKLTFVPDKSNSTYVITEPLKFQSVGVYHFCYALLKSTPVWLSDPINVITSPVECVDLAGIRKGMGERVTIKLKTDFDSSKDSLALGYNPPVGSGPCGSDNLVPEFTSSRVHHSKSDKDSVTFDVYWPLKLSNEAYVVCYMHNDVWFPICGCGISVKEDSDLCTLPLLPAIPSNFSPLPAITYVGQMITLIFEIPDNLNNYPILSISLVRKVSETSSCFDNPLIIVPSSNITRDSTSSHIVYRANFFYSYTLSPSTLIVCAETPLSSPFYSEVPTKGSVTPENVLTIRPYISFTVRPSLIQFRRALQTLEIMFMHVSKESDDILSINDQFSIVSSRDECINIPEMPTGTSDSINWVAFADSSFDTLPSRVKSYSSGNSIIDAFTDVFVTFSSVSVPPTMENRTFYLCYRLSGSENTWAAVYEPLVIFPPWTTLDCSFLAPVSGPRALQYISISASLISTYSQYGKTGDQIFLLPSGMNCADMGKQYLENLWEKWRITNVVVDDNNQSDSLMFKGYTFGDISGDWKLCYRFLDSDPSKDSSEATSYFSPLCPNTVTLQNPSPFISSDNMHGCFLQGQTLNFKLTHLSGVGVFTKTDTIRVISGLSYCQQVDSLPDYLDTIAIDGKFQTNSKGVELIFSSEENTLEVSVPRILLGMGTQSIQLCYTDSNKFQYRIPFPKFTSGRVEIASNQPSALNFLPSRPHIGMRNIVSFLPSTSNTEEIFLRGCESFPSLGNKDIVLLPAVNPSVESNEVTCDGSGFLPAAGPLPSSLGGICADALAVSPTTVSLYQVYAGENGRTISSVSLNSLKMGYYTACYKPLGCSIQDVSSPFLIFPKNPNSASVSPSPPRRGQIINVSFFIQKDFLVNDFLTPTKDRAALVPTSSSCWILKNTDGVIVSGTTSVTDGTFFFSANAPGLSEAEAQLTVFYCYLLDNSQWSFVTTDTLKILPANPVSFSADNAMTYQIFNLSITGRSLRSSDRVKIIALDDECNDTTKPPITIYSFIDGDYSSPVEGSSFGWLVSLDANTETSSSVSLLLYSLKQGTFGVCYILANDIVWTRLYSNLTIYPRIPESVVFTPSTALQGEAFSMEFTVGSNSLYSLAMSQYDRVILFSGENNNCLSMPSTNELIMKEPSDITLLPEKLTFLASSTNHNKMTLCYYLASGSKNVDLNLVSVDQLWKYLIGGFPLMQIGPNPEYYHIQPASPFIRGITNITYSGFGLQANEKKKDEVMFLPFSDFPTVPSSMTCQIASNSGKYRPEALGIHTIKVEVGENFIKQTLFYVPPSGDYASVSFWICYKLYGGFFDILHNKTNGIVAEPPLKPHLTFSAVGPQDIRSLKSSLLYTGEQSRWQLGLKTNAESGHEASEGIQTFFSDQWCLNPPVSYDLIDYQQLIFTSPLTFDTTLDRYITYPRAPLTSGSYTLCYAKYSEDQTSITEMAILALDIKVENGNPSVLATPLDAVAQQALLFTLDIPFSDSDHSNYVVLVKDEKFCTGLVPPSTASQLVVQLSPVLENSNIINVHLASADSGDYWICALFRSENMVACASRECARVIGLFRVTDNPTGGWITPSGDLKWSLGDVGELLFISSPQFSETQKPVENSINKNSPTDRSSSLVEKEMLLSTTINPNLKTLYSENWTVWVSMLPALSNVDYSINDVLAACLVTISPTESSPTADNNYAIQLTYNPSRGIWSTNSALKFIGDYTVCLSLNNDAKSRQSPLLYPPPERFISVVKGSVSSGALITSHPTVLSDVKISVTGAGLSSSDVLYSVLITVPFSQITDVVQDAACQSLPSYDNSIPNEIVAIKAIPITQGAGLSIMTWSSKYQINGFYSLCYRYKQEVIINEKYRRISSSPIPIASLVNEWVIEGSENSNIGGVNRPMTINLHGNSLSSRDAVAFQIVSSETSIAKNSPLLSLRSSICSSSSSQNYISLNVNTAKTNGSVSVELKKTGFYVLCFRSSVWLDVGEPSAGIPLPNLLSVISSKNVMPSFLRQPVCPYANITCSTTPIVRVLDENNKPIFSVGTLVVLHLYQYPLLSSPSSDGVLSDILLVESDAIEQIDSSSFSFPMLQIKKSGFFEIEAVTEYNVWSGSPKNSVHSQRFSVVSNDIILSSSLSCNPVGIIDAPTDDNSSSQSIIKCTISAKSSESPTSYLVKLNAGTATEVTLDSTNSQPFPSYVFSVTPPFSKLDNKVVIITVNPSEENARQLDYVENSPLAVRIGRIPEFVSFFNCFGMNKDLPSEILLPGEDQLSCVFQGRVVSQESSVIVNVVSPRENFQLTTRSDHDPSTDTILPYFQNFPDSLSGVYYFSSITIPDDIAYFEVMANLVINNKLKEDSIIGSSRSFTVLQNPSSDYSVISCGMFPNSSPNPTEPAIVPSVLLPDTTYGCGLWLRSRNNLSILGWGGGIKIDIPTGGSVVDKPITNTASFFFFTIQTLSGSMEKISIQVSSLTSPDNIFSNQESMLLIASLTKKPDTDSANPPLTTLIVKGTDLPLDAAYFISLEPSCIPSTVFVKANVQRGSEVDTVVLSYTIPTSSESIVYYVCILPANTEVGGRLIQDSFTYNGKKDDSEGIHGWALVLVILGAILLVVIIVVLGCVSYMLLCRNKRQKARKSENQISLRSGSEPPSSIPRVFTDIYPQFSTPSLTRSPGSRKKLHKQPSTTNFSIPMQLKNEVKPLQDVALSSSYTISTTSSSSPSSSLSPVFHDPWRGAKSTSVPSENPTSPGACHKSLFNDKSPVISDSNTVSQDTPSKSDYNAFPSTSAPTPVRLPAHLLSPQPILPLSNFSTPVNLKGSSMSLSVASNKSVTGAPLSIEKTAPWTSNLTLNTLVNSEKNKEENAVLDQQFDIVLKNIPANGDGKWIHHPRSSTNANNQHSDSDKSKHTEKNSGATVIGPFLVTSSSSTSFPIEFESMKPQSPVLQHSPSSGSSPLLHVQSQPKSLSDGSNLEGALENTPNSPTNEDSPKKPRLTTISSKNKGSDVSNNLAHTPSDKSVNHHSSDATLSLNATLNGSNSPPLKEASKVSQSTLSSINVNQTNKDEHSDDFSEPFRKEKNRHKLTPSDTPQKKSRVPANSPFILDNISVTSNTSVTTVTSDAENTSSDDTQTSK